MKIRTAAVLLALMMCACSTPRSVSPPPSIEPEIREVERIVREEIETPPSTCLMPPHDLAAVQPGRDWRDVALEAGETAITNARIARACQEWWARVEASRTEEESS